MERDFPSTVSLEELGLSKYEARAYFTLISKGEVSGSELAYYSEIPRTKIYPTLLKLEKKKLAIISKRKPIMCTAVSPEDAFDSIIHEQINKVNSLNTLVTDLKKINDQSKKTRGATEKSYFHLTASTTLDNLRNLINASKFSIYVTVDHIGLNLLSACKEQILAALRRDVKVSIIVSPSSMSSDNLKKIPLGATIKMLETSHNDFIFDEVEFLIIDSNTGKGETFPSTEILVKNHTELFLEMWKNAFKTDSFENMTNNEINEINHMINIVKENGLHHILSSSFNSKLQFDLLQLLESNGIHLKSKNLKNLIEIMNITLEITCSGNVEFDSKNKTITIESNVNSGHSLPWGTILESYLKQQGNKTKMIYQKKQSNGEKIHIKIN